MAKKSGVEEAYNLNMKSVHFYKMKLMLLALNCFEWEGLPNSIPQRFIEKSLYHNGIVAFVKDNEYDIICCKCNVDGNLNMYDEGVYYNLYATNGYNKTFDRDELVLLRNNKQEYPTILFTDYYVKKLYEIDRTIDVNIIQQKTSKIVTCEEAQKLTMQNLFMQYEGNVPFIYGYKALDKDSLNTIDLTSPYVADKLQSLKNDIWRECLDTIGINNANTSKKERLITDEVNSNNELIQLASDSFLESRQLACDELNEKFGCNVSVKRRVFKDGEIYGGIGNTSEE